MASEKRIIGSYEQSCIDFALYGNQARDDADYEENARYDQFDGLRADANDAAIADRIEMAIEEQMEQERRDSLTEKQRVAEDRLKAAQIELAAAEQAHGHAFDDVPF